MWDGASWPAWRLRTFLWLNWFCGTENDFLNYAHLSSVSNAFKDRAYIGGSDVFGCVYPKSTRTEANEVVQISADGVSYFFRLGS